jgi:hypothetical protein
MEQHKKLIMETEQASLLTPARIDEWLRLLRERSIAEHQIQYSINSLRHFSANEAGVLLRQHLYDTSDPTFELDFSTQNAKEVIQGKLLMAPPFVPDSNLARENSFRNHIRDTFLQSCYQEQKIVESHLDLTSAINAHCHSQTPYLRVNIHDVLTMDDNRRMGIYYRFPQDPKNKFQTPLSFTKKCAHQALLAVAKDAGVELDGVLEVSYDMFNHSFFTHLTAPIAAQMQMIPRVVNEAWGNVLDMRMPNTIVNQEASATHPHINEADLEMVKLFAAAHSLSKQAGDKLSAAKQHLETALSAPVDLSNPKNKIALGPVVVSSEYYQTLDVKKLLSLAERCNLNTAEYEIKKDPVFDNEALLNAVMAALNTGDRLADKMLLSDCYVTGIKTSVNMSRKSTGVESRLVKALAESSDKRIKQAIEVITTMLDKSELAWLDNADAAWPEQHIIRSQAHVAPQVMALNIPAVNQLTNDQPTTEVAMSANEATAANGNKSSTVLTPEEDRLPAKQVQGMSRRVSLF